MPVTPSIRNTARGACLLAALACAGSAAAQTERISLAPDLAHWQAFRMDTPLANSLSLRLGLAATGFQTDTAPGVVPRSDYDESEPMASALLDLHFERMGLRLTGGALYHRRPNGVYDSEGRYSYVVDQGRDALGIGASNSYRTDVEPYLGLGWDRAFGQADQLKLNMDFGFAFRSISNLEADTIGSGPHDGYTTTDFHLAEQFESFRYSFSAGLRYAF